ncbi:MAG: hypothetical protein IPM57_05985 [Oligoflexia bacterium]|nr:hypothetical protein [Oligoflexia bacterium]
MSIAKITIIGEGFRGLWLALELVKNKFSVTWLSLNSKVENDAYKYPWQMGSQRSYEKLNQSQKEFIDHNFKFTKADDFQVISKNMVLDFNTDLIESCLKKNFPKSYDHIIGYLKANHEDNSKLSEAYLEKLLNHPRGEYWPLEIIKNHRANELLDVYSEQLLSEDDYASFLQNCIKYVQAKGVNILKLRLNDIGKDGSKVTGIEVHDTNAFRPCDQLVIGAQTSLLKKNLMFLEETKCFDQVWVKFDIKMQPQSRPNGLEEFFSFAYDPMMPLKDDNLYLIRWKQSEKEDVVSVWAKAPYEETKKQSYENHLKNQVVKKLAKVLVGFEENFIQIQNEPFQLRPIYNEQAAAKLIKKNVWFMSEDADLGFEFFAILNTEKRILEGILKHYDKEISRDRKIHASPNGKSMDARV